DEPALTKRHVALVTTIIRIHRAFSPVRHGRETVRQKTVSLCSARSLDLAHEEEKNRFRKDDKDDSIKQVDRWSVASDICVCVCGCGANRRPSHEPGARYSSKRA